MFTIKKIQKILQRHSKTRTMQEKAAIRTSKKIHNTFYANEDMGTHFLTIDFRVNNITVE